MCIALLAGSLTLTFFLVVVGDVSVLVDLDLFLELGVWVGVIAVD